MKKDKTTKVMKGCKLYENYIKKAELPIPFFDKHRSGARAIRFVEKKVSSFSYLFQHIVRALANLCVIMGSQKQIMI